MFSLKIRSKFIKGIAIDSFLENTTDLVQGALPSVLRLPLTAKETQDAPSIHMIPVIEVGARILKGQLIATDHKAAYLHAPTSGTIQKIASFPIGYTTEFTLQPMLSVTYRQQFTDCIEIVPDGKDESIEYIPIDWQHCSPIDLYQKIIQSGISVNTAFLHQPQTNTIPTLKTLIINATECEPHIQISGVLMGEQAALLIKGIAIVAKLFSAQNLWIATHEKQTLTQKKLKKAIDHLSSDFEIKPQIVTVPAKYPLGHPSVLIQQLTGIQVTDKTNFQEIQEMKVACFESITLIAIQRAVIKGQPFISRTVHLTGRALLKPGHYEMLIGTPLSEALDQAALKPHKLHRLIMGSAMTGASLEDASIPITKTTIAIIAATEAEMPTTPQEQPCIRCGQCEPACPVNLLPDVLYRTTKAQLIEQAGNDRLLDCIECGACAAVCPSHIPLVGYFQFAKQQIQKTQITQEEKDLARIRFEQRTQRIEKEKTLKEIQRQQRQQTAIANRIAIDTTIAAEQNTPEQSTPHNVSYPTETPIAETPIVKTSTAETPTTEQLKNNYLKIRKIYQSAEKALGFSKKAGKSAEDIAHATNQLAKLHTRMQEAQTAMLCAEKAESQINDDKIYPK